MRICSFLPSATEILFALGLGEAVVGVSHECDFPPEARTKPRVVSTVIDQDRLDSETIDRVVRQHLQRRESLYRVDIERLRHLAPDLIVTQQLCEVCAIDVATTAKALASLPTRPRIVSLHPHTIGEMLGDIGRVGEATGRSAQALNLVSLLQARLERVKARVASLIPPRVACLEWFKPLMNSGHWVPEQVACAGGVDVLGHPGKFSRYVSWDDVVQARPEVLVLMPCGFPIARARRETALLTAQPAWHALPAVRQGRVYVVDGPSYFNCSGPRLVEGVEVLAGLLHPARCAGLLPPGAAEPLEAVTESA